MTTPPTLTSEQATVVQQYAWQLTLARLDTEDRVKRARLTLDEATVRVANAEHHGCPVDELRAQRDEAAEALQRAESDLEAVNRALRRIGGTP